MICLYWCQNGCQWLHTFRRYVRWRFNWTQSFDFIRKTRLGITVNVLIFSVVICKKNNRSRFFNPTILFDSLTYTYSGIYRWNIYVIDLIDYWSILWNIHAYRCKHKISGPVTEEKRMELTAVDHYQLSRQIERNYIRICS